MPCVYDDLGESDCKQKKELDKLTRMLCNVLTQIENMVLLDKIKDKESLEWWKEHKKADERRKKEELENKNYVKMQDLATIDKLKKKHGVS